MTAVMFGGMCWYDDAPHLVRRNVHFEVDWSGFGLSFDRRKSAQHRKENKVLVAASPLAVVFPVRLMRELLIYTGGSEDIHVFSVLNKIIVAKSLRTTAPGPKWFT